MNPTTIEQEDTAIETILEAPYIMILHNDDFNTFD